MPVSVLVEVGEGCQTVLDGEGAFKDKEFWVAGERGVLGFDPCPGGFHGREAW